MRYVCTCLVSTLALAVVMQAEEVKAEPGLRAPDQATPNSIVIASGTKVPLTLLNTLSSKQTAEGDRVYLETLYPVLVNGRIVVPAGSYVSGTVTQIRRPGRVKGRGESYCGSTLSHCRTELPVIFALASVVWRVGVTMSSIALKERFRRRKQG